MSHRPLQYHWKTRRRVDGRAKVSGETRYADDISLPRMLHCRLLRSPPLPYARLCRLMPVVRFQPGVHLVLTGQDMPTTFGILPVSQDDTRCVCTKVRFVGDPVAAVVASSELVAEEALSLIDVQYEPLPTIASPEEALATEDPRIHEYGDQGNIHKAVAMSFGSVDDGFAQADHIFEDVPFTPGNTHLPLETHAALAAALDPDGKLTIWSSTQTPHHAHRAIAKVLGCHRRGCG